jgi:hypothetical protein
MTREEQVLAIITRIIWEFAIMGFCAGAATSACVLWLFLWLGW